MTKKLNLIKPDSRLTIQLWPNTQRANIILSDHRFNNEEFAFQRDKPAKGSELRMIRRLGNEIGIHEAKVFKNTIELELASGTLPVDWVHNAIEIVKEAIGEAYNPEIYLNDMRWWEEPVYSSDSEEWEPVKQGVRMKGAVIGVPYKVAL